MIDEGTQYRLCAAFQRLAEAFAAAGLDAPTVVVTPATLMRLRHSLRPEMIGYAPGEASISGVAVRVPGR